MKTIIPYEKYLLPKYNDKLVALYIKDCFKQSSMVSNRKEYRALANDVMHIKNMKNSKEPVETLLQNLQETYFQNRPAMKDEFRKCMR